MGKHAYELLAIGSYLRFCKDFIHTFLDCLVRGVVGFKCRMICCIKVSRSRIRSATVFSSSLGISGLVRRIVTDMNAEILSRSELIQWILDVVTVLINRVFLLLTML